MAGDPIEKQIVKTPVIYQEIHLPGYQDSSGQISIDTSFVAYFGENMYRLNEISRLSEKLSEAAKAISALEKEFEENAVDTLGIADSGEDNAFVVVGRKNIMFFNMEHIATHGPEGVAETAEHEAIHHITISSGYNTNIMVLDSIHVARTRRTGFESMIIRTDSSDSRLPLPRFPASLFSTFINEYNYFYGFGGHSEDGTGEFLASFVHTLLHINRLPLRLNQPIRLNANDLATYRLTERAKGEILETYISLTSVLKDAAEKINPAHARFFEKTLNKLLEMKTAFTASANTAS